MTEPQDRFDRCVTERRGLPIAPCMAQPAQWFMSKRSGAVVAVCLSHARRFTSQIPGEEDPVWTPLYSRDEAIIAFVLGS